MQDETEITSLHHQPQSKPTLQEEQHHDDDIKDESVMTQPEPPSQTETQQQQQHANLHSKFKHFIVQLRKTKKVPLVTVTIGITAAILTYVLISGFEHISIRRSVRSICGERKLSLDHHLTYISDGLSVQVGLYSVWPTVNINSPGFQANYSKFVNRTNLSESLFQFQSLSFIYHVDPDERAYFENVYPGLRITRRISFDNKNASDFVFLEENYTNPLGYWVWLYNANMPNDSRTGWDMLTSPYRSDEIMSTLISGGTYVAPSELSDDGIDGFGKYIMRAYTPVYANETRINQTFTSSVNGIIGLYQGTVFASSIVKSSFRDREYVGVLFEIIDQRSGDDSVIYAYYYGASAGANYTSRIPLDWSTTAIEFSSGASVSWKIRCTGDMNFSASSRHQWFWIVLISFLVFLLFFGIALFLQSHFSHVDTVEKQVQERRIQLTAAMKDVQMMKECAEQANQQKSKFMAFLCHELRNPLHAIVATAGFLDETELDTEQKGFVSNLIASSNLMIAIVNDVLDLSKVESGKMELEFVEFDIRSAVNAIYEANLDKCKEKGIEFFCRVDNSVPQTLYGDPTRISQILFNLVSNAIKFTEKGFVKINLTETVQRKRPKSSPTSPQTESSPHVAWKHNRPPFWLQISVQDSGIGIDEEAFPRLFDAYAHEKLSVVRQYGGTGLGLAICKQLVSRMNGDIDVESEVKEGSTFRVRLCLGKGKPKLPSPVKEEKAPVVMEEKMDIATLESRLNRLRILYADDQPINRKLMERFLKKCNPKLTVVENGLEAVRYVRRARNIEKSRSQSRSRSRAHSIHADESYLDIILLDLNMPVMDGREAAMLIREIDEDIPIVAVTANSISKPGPDSNIENMDEDSLLLFRGIFSDVAAKPITKENLLLLLYRLTAAKRSGAQVPRLAA